MARTSSSVSSGLPTIRVNIGNQLFLFMMRRLSRTTLGQSSMEKGTALLGISFLAKRTDPVSKPASGTRTFFCGCPLTRGRWMGLLGSRTSESFLIRRGSTREGAIVQWLKTWCFTSAVFTISE